MTKHLTQNEQLELMKYLYQFKDDNKFHKLDKNLLNQKSHEEHYHLIYTLRDNALIATDTEIHFDDSKNKFVAHFSHQEEVKAKILPKGIAAVETQKTQYNN